jgi:acyl dehydratase
MPVHPELAGRVLAPTAPRDVNRSLISAFATAIGADDPVHHDVDAARAAGHPDVVAPPTYPIVIAFDAMNALLAAPDVGMDLRNVIHAEQRFESVRPIHAGDELTATLTVEAVRSMRGSDILTTRTELHTVDGEHVCTAFAKLAHTAPEDTA